MSLLNLLENEFKSLSPSESSLIVLKYYVVCCSLATSILFFNVVIFEWQLFGVAGHVDIPQSDF
jgi:hypothetical protein